MVVSGQVNWSDASQPTLDEYLFSDISNLRLSAKPASNKAVVWYYHSFSLLVVLPHSSLKLKGGDGDEWVSRAGPGGDAGECAGDVHDGVCGEHGAGGFHDVWERAAGASLSSSSSACWRPSACRP